MAIYVFRMICFLCCIGFLAPEGTLAVSVHYQTDTAISILSKNSVPSDETGEPQTHTWRVLPEANPDTTVSLQFFSNMSDHRLGHVVLSKSGEIIDVDIPGVNPSMMIVKDNLLLVPGYPVPCDILPFQPVTGKESDDPSSESDIVHVRRSTSTQTFVDTLEIKTYPVSLKTAQANGWVRDPDVFGPLQVIQVINRQTREVLSLQLWNPGDDWWIYEKTPFRESWRLP